MPFFLFLVIKLGGFIKKKQSRSFVISCLYFFVPEFLGMRFFDGGSLNLHFGGKSSIKIIVPFEAKNIQTLNHDANF